MSATVLHLFNSFEVGGVERQHMLLLERLIPDFHHFCWSHNFGPLTSELDQLKISYVIGGIEELKKILSFTKFDCILVRTNRYIRELVPLLKQYNSPVIYFRNYLRWLEGNGRFFDAELESLALSMADYCLFSGPMLQAPVLEAGIELPENELFFNAIDCSHFPLRAREFKEKSTIRVGMLGNLRRLKNQKGAIISLRELLKKQKINLRIGGAAHDQVYAEELRQTAKGLPVIFDGYVSDSKKFMDEIDILLVCSKIEGWPNVIMEAFASGVPVISTDIGDIREEFGTPLPGFLFEKDNTQVIPEYISKIADAKTYTEYSRRGIIRATHFNIDNQASRLSEIIKQTIKTAKNNKTSQNESCLYR